MDISQYDIIITEHAAIRAHERGIDADTLEDIVLNGKKKIFGKHHAKWIRTYDDISIICVGYIENNTIRVLTVETK
ncbi:MAG: hypothetical protein ACP5NW_04880 [Candidatus Woesearchaeota archaeon]